MTHRTTLATFSLCAIVAVGCYQPPNNADRCEEGTLCANGQPCTNGACNTSTLDAPPLVVDACVNAACVGTQLLGCGQPQECALGCTANTDGKDAHCIELKPSNGVTDWAITDGTLPLMVTSELTVDTETGAISEALAAGPTVVRSAGVGLRDGIYFATTPGGGPSVFAMNTLTIASGAALRLVGAPAAIVLINGDAIIAGRMDASAGLDPMRPAGPGAGRGGATIASAGGGCGGGFFGSSNMLSGGGGGGGGFADKGGSGGGETTPLPLGGDGGVNCNIVDLQPLRGGSGGGTGGAGSALTSFGFGGHGGGGLQLSVRNRLVIETTGLVVASGGGGGGGRYLNGGGGGGGTGGGLLLEAPVVIVNGKLFANGGGGGGGATNAVAGNDGAFGQESTIFAQGGGANGSGAQGGSGGTNNPPRDGRTGSSNAGGGGGSAGVIVMRSGSAMLMGQTSPTVRQLPMLTQ